MKKTSLIIVFFSIFISQINAQEKEFDSGISQEMLDHFIDKKIKFNQANSLAYCIQLYFGEESKAKSIKQKFESEFPDASVKMTFDTPWWKPQTGIYLSKKDADIALEKLRSTSDQSFPDALVVPYSF
jgi:hypothetical protein